MRGQNLRAALQVATALPGRTLLLALPVAASVALALATLAIDRGLTSQAEAAASSFGVDVISVRPGTRVIAGKSGSVNSLTDDDVEMLRSRLKGVKAVEGTRIEDGVPVSAGGKNGVYRVFGVRPPWAAVRQFGAGQGRFFDDDELRASARVCVVGRTVARDLFGSRDPIGQDVTINQVLFRVVGVLVTKGASPAEGDRDARIVIPITTFFNRLYRRVHLDQIVLHSTDASPAAMERLGEQVRGVLREQHRLKADEKDDFTIRLPERIAEEARGVSRGVFWLLLGLAVVCGAVAALVIVLVSNQAVRARRSEIGLRRALGAMPGDILRQFWAEGLTASLLGGVLGVLLGLLGAWATASWRHLAYEFNPLVVLAPLALVLLASLGGLVPARSAARLDPVEALRSR